MASEPPSARVVDRSPWAWLRGLFARSPKRAADLAPPIPRPPSKRVTIARLVELEPVILELDPQAAGVVLPAAHRDGHSISLRFGRSLEPPIPDLVVGEHAISGTLVFAGQAHHVVVPWTAISGARTEAGAYIVWDGDQQIDIAGPMGHRSIKGTVTAAEKRDVVTRMVDFGPALIDLDPRRPGVEAPEAHRATAQLVLRIGRELAPPIALELGDDAITCTLVFSGQPHDVVVPWSALYCVRYEDNRASTVWADDVPSDMNAS